MQDDKPGRWHRLRKLSFNRKDLTKRMRRAEGVTLRHARKFIFRRLDNIRDVRRHIIVWIVAVGVLIGASGLQLMWYQQNYRTTVNAHDGTYAEAVLGPTNTLNPLFATTSAEISAGQLLFSRLLTYDTSGTLSNDLATKVAVDGTGTVYTVTIRSDARWHDGIQLTAKDIAFTIGLLKNPVVRSNVPADWSSITVTVVDDTTVTFTLPTIIAAFPHALTFPIVPEHILAQVEPNSIRENEFSQSPVGSGPFKLRFVQDIDLTTGRKIIHLERNTHYYKGVTKLELFQLHVYNSQESIMQALTNGEVSAANDITGTNATQVNTKRYDVEATPIKSGVYAFLNTNKDILKDKAVRQALQRGADTNAIRDQLPSPSPTLDLPFINGQITGDIPQVAAYSPKEAQKLLDGAGWKLEGTTRKKDGVDLRLSVVTSKDNDYEEALEVLAGQWRELGVIIDTQIIDPNDVSQGFVQDILQKRNFDVMVGLLPIGADPDVFAYWHSSQANNSRGSNFSNYSNPISDDALVSARSRLEPSLRNAKYLTFARQWVADVPAIGLYQSTAHYVHNNSVSSFNAQNTLVSSIDRYADVLYWTAGSQTVFKTP